MSDSAAVWYRLDKEGAVVWSLTRAGDGMRVWQVYRIIDGREEVKGHGTRDMPIWGEVFRQPEGGRPVDETHAIGRILALVYYLQSIQEK